MESKRRRRADGSPGRELHTTPDTHCGICSTTGGSVQLNDNTSNFQKVACDFRNAPRPVFS
jgi:hypothetical protein